jgi:alanine dehydrogenase
MSEVAGRMAPQVGAHFLERQPGGRGVLLGGVPGVAPAHVVVLGAGTVGWNAGRIAAGMGADVRMVNRSVERLQAIDELAAGRVTTFASNRAAIERLVTDADLVIGAVLVPGGRAPVLVTEDMVRAMRPGSVIVDIAVDQGGSVATTHETSHADPVYERHGVLHYAVGNMPAAVPHTSTYALTNATLPYVVALATKGVRAATAADPALAHGVNTDGGRVVNPVVATALAT